jgi:hypothetical protein
MKLLVVLKLTIVTEKHGSLVKHVPLGRFVEIPEGDKVVSIHVDDVKMVYSEVYSDPEQSALRESPGV